MYLLNPAVRTVCQWDYHLPWQEGDGRFLSWTPVTTAGLGHIARVRTELWIRTELGIGIGGVIGSGGGVIGREGGGGLNLRQIKFSELRMGVVAGHNKIILKHDIFIFNKLSTVL